MLFWLLACGTLLNAMVFGWHVSTTFLILLTGIVAIHIGLKWLCQNHPGSLTTSLTWTYRMGLIFVGLTSIFILILVSIPQFSCQGVDEKKLTSSSYILILGAGLKNGNQLSYNLKSRLEKALQVLEINPNLTVIVSGGQGHDETISEAQVMKAYLMEHGVPENQIVMEDQSRSTYQNLVFSKAVLNQSEELLQQKKVILVTQDFHIFRAKMIASKLNLNLTPICSYTPLYLKTNYMIREIPAVMNDGLGNILK